MVVGGQHQVVVPGPAVHLDVPRIDADAQRAAADADHAAPRGRQVVDLDEAAQGAAAGHVDGLPVEADRDRRWRIAECRRHGQRQDDDGGGDQGGP